MAARVGFSHRWRPRLPMPSRARMPPGANIRRAHRDARGDIEALDRAAARDRQAQVGAATIASLIPSPSAPIRARGARQRRRIQGAPSRGRSPRMQYPCARSARAPGRVLGLHQRHDFRRAFGDARRGARHIERRAWHDHAARRRNAPRCAAVRRGCADCRRHRATAAATAPALSCSISASHARAAW